MKKTVIGLLVLLLLVPGCGTINSGYRSDETAKAAEGAEKAAEGAEKATEGTVKAAGGESSVGLEGRRLLGQTELEYLGSRELHYSDQFAIDDYEGGYQLLSIKDGTRILVVPEGKEIPKQLDEGVIVLQQPVKNLYLVATAAMDMFCELDALDAVRFSGQKEEGWHLDEAKEAMQSGRMIYAGKYNMPDYEQILAEGCSLAIENMMISHSPEVVEKLEQFGIPVMIDYASYETHPLGRSEWIKFYGAILGKKEEAQAAFAKQEAMVKEVVQAESSGKTIAFFFLTSNGTVNVRTASDYIPKMIELAGGVYQFGETVGDQAGKSSTSMQMEEFYAAAKEADYLIYNSTIDGELTSLEALMDKSELLQDFKAVKEGHVWCTSADFYQRSMAIGSCIRDFHNILSGDPEKQKKVEHFYQLGGNS